MTKLAALCSMLLATACSSGGSSSSGNTGATGSGPAPSSTGTAGAAGPGTASSSGSTGGVNGTAGTSTGGGNSASGTGSTGAFSQATHPALPQIQFSNGPVLASPEIHPVFFNDGDPAQPAQVQDYLAWLFAESSFTDPLVQYGVSAPTVEASILPVESSPGVSDEAGLGRYLAGKLNGDDPAWPQADADTLFVVFLPLGNTVSSDAGTSCADFSGFHSEFQLDSAHQNEEVSFAVVINCPTGGPVVGGSDGVQFALSAQIANAATDPEPDVQHGYAGFGSGPWSDATPLHNEIADVCLGNYLRDQTSGNLQARLWSNAAAATQPSIDPCVPQIDGGVYFNTAPPFTQYTVSPEAHVQQAQLNVIGFSQAPLADWIITAHPLSIAGAFSSDPTLGGMRINNGVSQTLTFTVPANTPSGAIGGAWITSQTDEELDAGIVSSSWPVVVKVQ